MAANLTPISAATPSGSLATTKLAPKSLTPKFDELDEKQRQLVKEYLVDFNQSAAARRAGYSSKTAGTQASALFKKLHIREAVAELVEQKTALTRMTILEEIVAVAMLDPGDYFSIDERGNVTLKPTGEMTRNQRLGIAVVKMADNQFGTSREIKMADKLGALDKLAKIMNLYPEKGEGGVNVNFNNIKVGAMVIPSAVPEAAWEAMGRDQEKDQAVIEAQLRSVA